MANGDTQILRSCTNKQLFIRAGTFFHGAYRAYQLYHPLLIKATVACRPGGRLLKDRFELLLFDKITVHALSETPAFNAINEYFIEFRAPWTHCPRDKSFLVLTHFDLTFPFLPLTA